MRPFLKIPFLVLVLTSSSYVNAEDLCDRYIAQTVQPLQASGFWKRLANVPTVKGEYETTAAFEARAASAMNQIAEPVIIEVPLQRKYVLYDADANRLNVQAYAFANGTTQYDGVFGYGTPLSGKIKYGTSDNIEVVLPSEEKQMGSYVGISAMGAKIRVTKIKRATKAIFER